MEALERNIKRPNFFIVGAAKAGTTALHSILSLHSQIYMSPVKEPNYFSKDIYPDNLTDYLKKKSRNNAIEYDKRGDIISKHKLFVKNIDDYLTLFENATNEHKILGEASVSYLFSRQAASKIYNFNPLSKVLILLREPIDRAFSHYLMDLKVGNTKNENFLEAVLQDFKSEKELKWDSSHLYVELGLYYQQIRRFLKLFPKESVLIIKYDDFKKDSLNTVKCIQEFLGVEYEHINTGRKKNTAKLPKNRFAKYLLNNSFLKKYFKKTLSAELANYFKTSLLSDKNMPSVEDYNVDDLIPFFKSDVINIHNNMNVDLRSWDRYFD